MDSKHSTQERNHHMGISPLNFTPSFKGLIYSDKDNIAVNAKYITSMKELDSDINGQKRTSVQLTDKTYVVFNTSLQNLLKTYNRAAASEVYTVKMHEDSPEP